MGEEESEKGGNDREQGSSGVNGTKNSFEVSGVARASKFGERNVLLDSGIFETENSEVVIRFRVRS